MCWWTPLQQVRPGAPAPGGKRDGCGRRWPGAWHASSATPFRLWYQVQTDSNWNVRECLLQVGGEQGQTLHLYTDGQGHWTDAAGVACSSSGWLSGSRYFLHPVYQHASYSPFGAHSWRECGSSGRLPDRSRSLHPPGSAALYLPFPHRFWRDLPLRRGWRATLPPICSSMPRDWSWTIQASGSGRASTSERPSTYGVCSKVAPYHNRDSSQDKNGTLPHDNGI